MVFIVICCKPDALDANILLVTAHRIVLMDFKKLKLTPNELGLFTDQNEDTYLVFRCPKDTKPLTIFEIVTGLAEALKQQEQTKHLDNLYPPKEES